MSKPCVALFRNVFLPYSETFIYDSLKYYAGFTAIVFAKKRTNQQLFSFEPVYTPARSGTTPLDRFNFAAGIYSSGMSKAFGEHKPAIIHAHFGQSGVLAIPYARKLKIPMVVSFHGNDVGILMGAQKYHPKWWYYAASFSRLVRHSRLFLAASQDLKLQLSRLGCPPDQILVHRLGIDLTQFEMEKTRRGSERLSIYMIGRLVEKKGFQYGVRAFAALAHQVDEPELELVLVGDGPSRSRLKQLAIDLKVSSKVRFLGKQPHEVVRRHLRQDADILLCPSVIARNQDRDSGLIVAKEAAASGVPAIGTYHGGIPEIVEHKQTGFLTQERDSDALSAFLRQLVSNPDLRATFGKNARTKMEREYDIRNQMAELEKIYLEAIEEEKRL